MCVRALVAPAVGGFFRREKYVRQYGGPDGGNGGVGGDIIFEAVAHLEHTDRFSVRTARFKAPRGGGGSGS